MLHNFCFFSIFNYRNRLLTQAGSVLGVISRLSGVIMIMIILRDVRGVGLKPRRTEILSHKVASEAQILYPDALEVSRDVLVEVLKTLSDPTREFSQLGYRALGGRGRVAKGPRPEVFLWSGEEAE